MLVFLNIVIYAGIQRANSQKIPTKVFYKLFSDLNGI